MNHKAHGHAEQSEREYAEQTLGQFQYEYRVAFHRADGLDKVIKRMNYLLSLNDFNKLIGEE